MTFLTGWRLALAADLLRESGATVGAVAHKVGYGSPFALSTAFKRVHGISPREHQTPSRPRLTPPSTAVDFSATFRLGYRTRRRRGTPRTCTRVRVAD